MDEEKIRKAFEEMNITDEIKCPEAFVIAEKFDIEKLDIARYCNKNGVKIRACQLGCFR